jgi:hypothetical protein
MQTRPIQCPGTRTLNFLNIGTLCITPHNRVAALLVNVYTSICTTKGMLKLQCVHKAVTYMYEVQCTCVWVRVTRSWGYLCEELSLLGIVWTQTQQTEWGELVCLFLVNSRRWVIQASATTTNEWCVVVHVHTCVCLPRTCAPSDTSIKFNC